MAFVVYLLCSIMSLGCAAVLMRAYLKNRSRLAFLEQCLFCRNRYKQCPSVGRL